MKKLIITEQDKNHIRSLYGLLNEETEPDLKKNHDPNRQPSLVNKRPNCDPFCQFDAEEVKVIQKCFTASQFIGYTQMDKNQTKEDKEETKQSNSGDIKKPIKEKINKDKQSKRKNQVDESFIIDAS